MSRRITRKMLKENEFVSVMDRVIQWFNEYWRPVVFAFGAVVVVILVWWAASAFSGSRARNASAALADALSAIDGVDGQPGDQAVAEEKLREVVDRYGRSRQAAIARLHVARIELERGEVDSARTTLMQLVERNPDNALGYLAMLDLIHLRLASGQSSEVAAELQAMVAGADRRLPRDTALYELGLLMAGQEETEAARTHLQKLIDEFPDSPYRFATQQRIGELG